MGRMPPALARYWAKKRGKRRARRTRRASSGARSVPRMARRRTRSRRRRGFSKKSFNLAGFAVGAHAIGQMVEPFISKGVIGHAQAGNWGGVVQALREGGKEAASVANLLQAFGPVVGLAIVRRVIRGTGFRVPTVMGVRAI